MEIELFSGCQMRGEPRAWKAGTHLEDLHRCFVIRIG